MKRTTLITSLVLMFGCSSTDLETLQDRGGVLYEINSEKPFSGAVHKDTIRKPRERLIEGKLRSSKIDGKWTEFYESEQKSFEAFYDEGNPSGSVTWWHRNGQKAGEGFFNGYERDGQWTGWWDDGQKLLEGVYSKGNKVGDWTRWYKNGRKEFEWSYSEGRVYLNSYWTSMGTPMIEDGNGDFLMPIYKTGLFALRGGFKGSFKDGQQFGIWYYQFPLTDEQHIVIFKEGKIIGKWSRWEMLEEDINSFETLSWKRKSLGITDCDLEDCNKINSSWGWSLGSYFYRSVFGIELDLDMDRLQYHDFVE
tara:strand:- start:194 stop:1117 length:924 start_codon:yes stop_codon:yes gene_type:complete